MIDYDSAAATPLLSFGSQLPSAGAPEPYFHAFAFADAAGYFRFSITFISAISPFHFHFITAISSLIDAATPPLPIFSISSLRHFITFSPLLMAGHYAILRFATDISSAT